MKNFLFTGLVVSLLFAPFAMAREALLPSSSAVIETGQMDTNTLLASSGGEVFIELSENVHFVHEEGGISFSGEILPPAIIELDVPTPKLKMEEIVSFELISDTGEHVIFADRYDTAHRRNIMREEVLDPDNIFRSSWVKLIVPIEDPAVGHPELWEFISDEDGWMLIGGITGDESPEGIRVFTAIMRRTGVYSVFDSYPPPRHFADEFDGSQEEVSDEDSLWNESDVELPEGLEWEDIMGYEEDAGAEGGEFMDEVPAIPEANISVNDRMITADDKVSLEARKSQLISQISRETDVEKIKDIRELLTLIERKILIADQREQLISRESQLSEAIPTAATEKLASDLSDQLSAVRAQLLNLKDVSLDERMIELEGELQNIESVPELILDSPFPVFDEPEEIEIPVDGELPKSGADDVEKPSMAFPLALMSFVLVIVGSMFWAAKRKA